MPIIKNGLVKSLKIIIDGETILDIENVCINAEMVVDRHPIYETDNFSQDKKVSMFREHLFASIAIDSEKIVNAD